MISNCLDKPVAKLHLARTVGGWRFIHSKTQTVGGSVGTGLLEGSRFSIFSGPIASIHLFKDPVGGSAGRGLLERVRFFIISGPNASLTELNSLHSTTSMIFIQGLLTCAGTCMHTTHSTYTRQTP